jgi:hypothetical protein
VFKIKKLNMKKTILNLCLIAYSGILFSQNPIIQTNYTADPAPMVYNDRLYVYTTTMRMIPPGL